MLPFLRPDLASFVGYQPNPGHGVDPLVGTVVDALDTNESPWDLPADLKTTLAATYRDSLATNRYPDGSHRAIKALLTDYVNESLGATHPALTLGSSPITPEHLSLGNGSDELIRSLLIATALGGQGSVLVADPTFSMYGILASTLGIPVVRVGRNPQTFEVDLVAAQGAIEGQTLGPGVPPVRILFMVHPNSPTANGLTPGEVAWLQGIPDEVLVVIDEAYFEFSQSTLVGEVLNRSNWVITRTFSKAFRLAAHRVGYAVAHPEVIQVLESLRLPYNLPSFSQAATIAALTHRQNLLSNLDELRQERERLGQHFKQCPQLRVYPSVGNFLFLHLQESWCHHTTNPYGQVVQGLQELGTLIRHTGGGLRITVGDVAMNDRTIDRLGQVLQHLT